jgi:hypothetical protein
MNKPKPTLGHQLILRGFERWQEYIREEKQRVRPKSLTDFYAEAFDEELELGSSG